MIFRSKFFFSNNNDSKGEKKKKIVQCDVKNGTIQQIPF